MNTRDILDIVNLRIQAEADLDYPDNYILEGLHCIRHDLEDILEREA